MIKPLFLYQIPQNPQSKRFVVCSVTAWDWMPADTGWMADPELPKGLVLEPAVDFEGEKYYFETEYSALRFMAQAYSGMLLKE